MLISAVTEYCESEVDGWTQVVGGVMRRLMNTLDLSLPALATHCRDEHIHFPRWY